MVARTRHGRTAAAQAAAAASEAMAAAADTAGAVLVRVQDQCMTSEIFGSLKCDCKQQLDYAMQALQARAGRQWAALQRQQHQHPPQSAGVDTALAKPFSGAPVADGTDSDASMPTTRSTSSVASLATGSADADSVSDSDADSAVGGVSGRQLEAAAGQLTTLAVGEGVASPASSGTVSGGGGSAASAPPALPAAGATARPHADAVAGVVVYLMQEGRGIGLASKVAAYALQEDEEEAEDGDSERAGRAGCAACGVAASGCVRCSGSTGSAGSAADAGAAAAAPPARRHGLDTVDANRALGLPDDVREYGAVVDILGDLGLVSQLGSKPAGADGLPPAGAAAASGPGGTAGGGGGGGGGRGGVYLLTNNPRKLSLLRELGVPVSDRVPCHVPPSSPLAARYLRAKAERMGHDIPLHVYSSGTFPPAPQPPLGQPGAEYIN
jgi:GTP cyclohydrolase II